MGNFKVVKHFFFIYYFFSKHNTLAHALTYPNIYCKWQPSTINLIGPVKQWATLRHQFDWLKAYSSILIMWPHTMCSRPCLMGQSLCWIKFDMKLTCCLAFTFVIVGFLVDKPCRPLKPLLIYALYLTVNTYKLIGDSPLFRSWSCMK